MSDEILSRIDSELRSLGYTRMSEPPSKFLLYADNRGREVVITTAHDLSKREYYISILDKQLVELSEKLKILATNNGLTLSGEEPRKQYNLALHQIITFPVPS